jgi:hypothetical protein
MVIKAFPANLQIENTPVFFALLERFNQIYQSDLSTINILNSRSSFNAFFDFVFYCALNGKITIPKDQMHNFMISLHNLRQKYSQNLRSMEKYSDEILRKIYYLKGFTKADPKVVKDRYRFDQAYSLMRLLMENQTRENGKKRFEHLKGTMEIILNELDTPNIDRILIALLHDIQEDLPEYADVVRKV